MKPGDKIRLERRYSGLNGWSIRPDLDGKIVTVIEVEDRPNGCITATLDGVRLAFFRDAVGEVIKGVSDKWAREETLKLAKFFDWDDDSQQVSDVTEALTRAREEGRMEILARMPTGHPGMFAARFWNAHYLKSEEEIMQSSSEDAWDIGFQDGLKWLRARLEGKT